MQKDLKFAFSFQQMLLNADLSTKIFVQMKLLPTHVQAQPLITLKSMQMNDLDLGFDMEMDLQDRSKQLNSLTIQE